ncbi:transposase [Nocardioides jensenii]|uniref:transposase n=1 Tax=Nocardioides jensenii TaxID=1843 RepID=UPI000AF3142B|nr:transposase [Nocardioides jensenii]
MFVLTVDQRSSRTTDDLVPTAVETWSAGARLPFERTAGDEIQAVYDDPKATADLIEGLLRTQAWNIGVGIGEVELPLPDSARAGRGPAYLHARSAVTRAKNAPGRICAVGGDDYRADQLETVLWLWAALLGRRTSRGWEVADLVAEGLNHEAVGKRLGISQSAVSQRAQAAGLVEGRRARDLVEQMLDAMVKEA